MKIISAVFLATFFLIIGFFLSQKLYSKSETNLPGVVDGSNSALNVNDAHTYSVNFRNNVKYCNNPSYYEKSGFFEVSEQGIENLLTAIRSIKSQFATRPPQYYRCILGREGVGNTFVMVVALDDNGYEYQTDKFMSKIGGSIPCPTMCDINKSRIIMGDGLRGQNACK